MLNRTNKVKLPRCKACRKEFQPHHNFGAVVCSPDCAINFALAIRAKNERAASKLATKAKKDRLDKLKSRSDWLKEAQVVFNKFIRERDAGQPCISCGTSSGCKVNAGHFLSVGAAPHLRFNEQNVHLQCEKCNSYLSGNIAKYRPRLIAKIGLEAVEALESNNTPAKWSIDELKQIKVHYVAKLKELKK
jgi:intein/homing endonuclease